VTSKRLTVKTDRGFPLNPLTIETKPAFEVITDGRYMLRYTNMIRIIKFCPKIIRYFLPSCLTQTYKYSTHIEFFLPFSRTKMILIWDEKKIMIFGQHFKIPAIVLRSGRGLQIMNFGTNRRTRDGKPMR
jgi:hypothetical protein